MGRDDGEAIRVGSERARARTGVPHLSSLRADIPPHKGEGEADHTSNFTPCASGRLVEKFTVWVWRRI
jgi:hypothetical protein